MRGREGRMLLVIFIAMKTSCKVLEGEGEAEVQRAQAVVRGKG